MFKILFFHKDFSLSSICCAKRDEPPSRRRPANPPFSRVSFFPQILQHDGRRLRGIVFFRVFIGLPQIRVHSCAFVVDNRCLTLQFKPLYALSFMKLHSIVSLISTTATCRVIVIDPAHTCAHPPCRQMNGLCRCPHKRTSKRPSLAHCRKSFSMFIFRRHPRLPP